ncbi:hypothetical protein FHR47_002681 [Xanthomonas arboricola]|nr:hypothetical protein [Xanthomonas cannabis]
MYLRRVLRWWAGKDPATKLQLTRFKERHHTTQRLKPIPRSPFPIPNSQFPIPDSRFPIPTLHPAHPMADRIAT